MNNMNNMNLNAMMNMNQMMGWNYNMNQFNQFMQMVNSNPTFLMLFNQMMNQQCFPNNNMMMCNQFIPNNNPNMVNSSFINGGSPNMQFQQNNMNMQFQQNNANNMQFQQNKDPYKINLTFRDTTDTKRALIIAEPNEHMTSVINKYINKTGDLNESNLYLFNGKRIVQSLTVSELGIIDGSEIYVNDIGGLKGGTKKCIIKY